MDMFEVLEKFGIGSESVGRIKLGRGVVGKMSTITIISIIAIGAIAWELNWWPVTAGLGILIFIIFIISVRNISSIARERPDVALLEGAEFLLYHQKISTCC